LNEHTITGGGCFGKTPNHDLVDHYAVYNPDSYDNLVVKNGNINNFGHAIYSKGDNSHFDNLVIDVGDDWNCEQFVKTYWRNLGFTGIKALGDNNVFTNIQTKGFGLWTEGDNNVLENIKSESHIGGVMKGGVMVVGDNESHKVGVVVVGDNNNLINIYSDGETGMIFEGSNNIVKDSVFLRGWESPEGEINVNSMFGDNNLLVNCTGFCCVERRSD